MFNASRDFDINGGAFNNVGRDQVNNSGNSHNTHNDFSKANFNSRNYGDGMVNTGVNDVTAHHARRGRRKGNERGRDSSGTPPGSRRKYDDHDDHSSSNDDVYEDKRLHARPAAQPLQQGAELNQLALWQRLDELALLRLFFFITILFASIFFWKMYRAS
ncbi:hypothetical protein Moror_5942 [Moniliophthora roreri MCA 2997]|uniref:Uncharacterized protein n=1 Tax=Moniliophthora roreri (strain MCA 2997) TaxID=1381753 RepID=V2WXW1_MONRO|nr:hypothetical protein Moror_5942 [Moniliophthora roreri MCA 2997]